MCNRLPPQFPPRIGISRRSFALFPSGSDVASFASFAFAHVPFSSCVVAPSRVLALNSDPSFAVQNLPVGVGTGPSFSHVALAGCHPWWRAARDWMAALGGTSRNLSYTLFRVDGCCCVVIGVMTSHNTKATSNPMPRHTETQTEHRNAHPLRQGRSASSEEFLKLESDVAARSLS